MELVSKFKPIKIAQQFAGWQVQRIFWIVTPTAISAILPFAVWTLTAK
jgi:hypothetical protein